MPPRPRKSTKNREVPVRITSAGEAPEEELDHRQRRYIIAMTVRTLCFLGAVAVGPGWLRWVLLSGAVFLPYIAVVIANTTSQRTDTFEVEGVDVAALPPAATTYRIESSDDRGVL
ncbi:DUF3099 domain-containing protein [Nocardioides alkalitolerans]|uniref:DUF3099 domain-containing protein n=1 Tax=Nocardioides alkalitolerans TaxID=281714 RepID=UPI000405D2F5|nr:DUF3099 domain-containing protein [Nocardioides alkalitolerans]